MATRYAAAGSTSWASRCVASSSRVPTSSRALSSSSSRSVVRRNQRTYGDEEADPESFAGAGNAPAASRSDVAYDRSNTASSENPVEKQQKLMDKYYAHSHPGWKPTYDYAVLPDPPPLPKTHGIHVATLRMTANEKKNLEFYSQWCYLSARSFGMPARRPERLPRSKELITVPKGPFVHKKFQENFEKLTFTRDLKVFDTSRETLDLWMRYIARNAMGGLTMKVKIHEWVDYGWGKKDIEAVEAQFEGVSGDDNAIRRRAYELVKQMAGQKEADKMLKAIPAPEPEAREHVKSEKGEKPGKGDRSKRSAKEPKAHEPAQAGSTEPVMEVSATTARNVSVAEPANATPEATMTSDTAVAPAEADAAPSPTPVSSSSTSETTTNSPVPTLQATEESSTDTPDMARPTTTVVSSEENVVETAPALEVSSTSEAAESTSSTSETITETAQSTPAPSTEAAAQTSTSTIEPEASASASDAHSSEQSAPETTQATGSADPSQKAATKDIDVVADTTESATPVPAEETVEEKSKAETESAISKTSPDEPVKVVKPRAKRTTKAAAASVPSSAPETSEPSAGEPADSAEVVPKQRVSRKKKDEAEETAAASEVESTEAPKKKTRAKKVDPVEAGSEIAPEVKTPKKRVTKKEKEAAQAAEVGKEAGGLAVEVKVPKKRVTKKKAEGAKEVELVGESKTEGQGGRE